MKELRLSITKYQYHDFAMLLHSFNSMQLGRFSFILSDLVLLILLLISKQRYYFAQIWEMQIMDNQKKDNGRLWIRMSDHALWRVEEELP